MRLTQVLRGPPVFRYWKHFGAGYQRRQPNFKWWRHAWISRINRRVIPDHTLPVDKLPPDARVLDVEDLLQAHIDALPDEIIQNKQSNKVVYDHPWPFNVRLDPTDDQRTAYCYDIHCRFFKPELDCQVLTNTLIESDSLSAQPPIEPTSEHMEHIKRQYEWATSADSILVRQPKDRASQYPRLDQNPRRKFGISKERKEINIMNGILSYAQTLLTKHYHERANKIKLDEMIAQRSLAYPHCVVPFERDDDRLLNLDLFIDSMIVGKQPLPLINTEPSTTKQREPVNIKPRTWRSLLEQSNKYSPAWSFTLSQDAQLHTIQISSRIKRKHRDSGEMLARSILHSFGLASQYARLRAMKPGSPLETSVLQEPLRIKEVNNRDLLEQPIVLQSISYDHEMGTFQFLRYQLNTLKFDDHNTARIKNQAWHSGPISELDQALRFYLDFLTFDASMVPRMLQDIETARLRALQSSTGDDDSQKRPSPEVLAEGY